MPSSELTATRNRFSNIADEVESAPQGQRAGRLIDQICQQMQQSNSSETKQLSTELAQEKPNIVRALQQGG